jgi:hypothetical protein
MLQKPKYELGKLTLHGFLEKLQVMRQVPTLDMLMDMNLQPKNTFNIQIFNSG